MLPSLFFSPTTATFLRTIGLRTIRIDAHEHTATTKRLAKCLSPDRVESDREIDPDESRILAAGGMQTFAS